MLESFYSCECLLTNNRSIRALRRGVKGLAVELYTFAHGTNQ